MTPQNEHKIVFYDELVNLHDLYTKVRKTIIYVENFDPERKMYIAPMNELRSALDHIFRGIDKAETGGASQYELKEAKEHLTRAGYDAFELLIGNLGQQIISQLSSYSSDTISVVFPDYFREYKPKMLKIKEEIAELRAEKKNCVEDAFNSYFDQIEELISIEKNVSTMIPSLDELENKRKKERRSDLIKSVFWGAIASFITGIIVYLLTAA